ncbi:hypothetical protein Ade02nite_51750 [Paractinoplanes deccanensis]|uniref:Uncharacterized protein n=1 Tax=Paractinoplanes deccanensis TaxID=113561 RepID=A0ABQ3Y967_9ACTN|nr:hypothetical protein [Actinoplanes deccanensis]GID76534.1 hypothetical protein Ade02nite_51750 [Actinoplanes deccanensis]
MRVLLRVESVVAAAALTAFLLLFGILGGVSDPAPAARWLALGVLVAPALMAYAHKPAAAWAALLGAVLWTPLATGYAAVLVVWAYAGVCVLVARRERPPAALPVPHRKPPPPYALPHVGAPAEAAGFSLLLLSAAGVVWVAVDDGAVPWLAATVAAFGLACALLARAVREQSALRRLFNHPQPVHAVRAVEQEGYVHVLLPATDDQTALEFAFDVAEPRPRDEDDDAHTVPGVLYGTPRQGEWCVLEVGDRLHVPVGPVGEVITVPYDVVHGLPREVEDDEEQLVDPEALRPADRDAGAFQAREHRIAPVRAWVTTVTIGAGGALGAGEIGHVAGLPAAGVLAVVAVAAAAGFEFGWRSQLRQRLRWHAGGVAAVGFRGRDRQPWATDSAIVYDDGNSIVLTAGESVMTVPVPMPWPKPQAGAGRQRTPEELVAALRDARTRSLALSPLPPPPEIQVPRRPVALYLAWAAVTAGSAFILI